MVNYIILVISILALLALAVYLYSSITSNKPIQVVFPWLEKIRSKIKSYWHKEEAEWLSTIQTTEEVIITPLYMGFALFILFPEILKVFNASSSPNEFLLLLAGDTVINPAPYAFFAFIFLIWVIIKGLCHRKERLDRKAEREQERKDRKAGWSEFTKEFFDRFDKIIGDKQKNDSTKQPPV